MYVKTPAQFDDTGAKNKFIYSYEVCPTFDHDGEYDQIIIIKSDEPIDAGRAKWHLQAGVTLHIRFLSEM
jgi:hypothetical protein